MRSLEHHGPQRSTLPRMQRRGLSLIEMMVGVALGMMVVLGGLNLLWSTQHTGSAASDAVRLQLKADNVLRTLGAQIMQSGAVDLRESAPGQVVFSNEFTGYDPATVSSAGSFLNVHGEEGSGANSSDVLRLSFEDDGKARDCLGQRTLFTAGSGTNRVDTQFRIVGTKLMCLGSGSTTEQVVAEDVEDFQVLYTVRTGPAGAGSFQTYDASQLPAGLWRSVSAVHVCLRVAMAMRDLPMQDTLTGCQQEVVAADGRLRRVVRRTFAIRNAST